MAKRLHIALGGVGIILLAKILVLNFGENILQQWLGAKFEGITIETILLGAAFSLMLWFAITKGRK